jgi:hypothetical protein
MDLFADIIGSLIGTWILTRLILIVIHYLHFSSRTQTIVSFSIAAVIVLVSQMYIADNPAQALIIYFPCLFFWLILDLTKKPQAPKQQEITKVI